MLRSVAGRDLLLGPRSRGLKFNTHLDNVVTLSPGEEIVVDGLKVRGFETVHGPLLVKLGPFKKVVKPGPEERTGWGAIGFDIAIDGRRIVNLGDSILLTDAWQSLCNPDLLMIPIGGRVSGNTMDETEALQAVEAIRPKLVIPCHYNCPALFTRHYNPGDADQFKAGVEKLGIRCAVLGNGESIDIH
jgi:L-ascorbate metabolism protein UlaG (beta-lactamase superfamily)